MHIGEYVFGVLMTKHSFYGGKIESYQFTSVEVLSGYVISEALSGAGGNQNYHFRHYMLLFFTSDWSFSNI
jgi:hypothetical protein